MNCENIFRMNLTKVNNSEDRFFKYKAAHSVSVPVVVCEELLSLESLVQLFKLMDEFYLKLFNVKLEYNPIPYGELTTNGTSIVQIKDMLGVLYPVELSDIAKDNFWYYTPVFLTSELLLITGPPTEVEKYSMSFLTIDNTVSYLLVSCIVVLPLLAKLSEFVTNRGQRRPQEQTSIRRKIQNHFNFSWDFVCIFFFEPFNRVPKCISCRITIGSWLIAILMISIFMGSFLKTELYSTEHILIDSLETFSKYTKAKIKFNPTDIAARFFKEWETSIMENEPQLSLASRIEYFHFEDALQLEIYLDAFSGKTGIFVPQFYIENLMPVLLEGDADFRKLVFYFNAKRIKNLLFVFPISSEAKRCPEYIEQMTLGMMMATETKFTNNLFMRNNFYISRVAWKKPLKSLAAMSINETYGTFLLFLYGVGIATATLIFEVIIKLAYNFNGTRF